MEPYDYWSNYFEGFFTTFNEEDQTNIEGIQFLFMHALSVWDLLPDQLPDLADLNDDMSDPEVVYEINHPEEWHRKEDSNLYTALLIYRASYYRGRGNWPLSEEMTPYYTAMQNAGYTMGSIYKL